MTEDDADADRPGSDDEVRPGADAATDPDADHDLEPDADADDGPGYAIGDHDLPTVRVVVDFQPDCHLLFNVNDEQAETVLERVREERASAPDAQVNRLAFEFTAGQIEQTSRAFRRMGDTDAADAALVDLTVTEDGAPPPSLTVMLSMNDDTASTLAAGFADAVRRNDTGEWFVELPAVSMELFERALDVALDGAEQPTDDALRQLRDER